MSATRRDLLIQSGWFGLAFFAWPLSVATARTADLQPRLRFVLSDPAFNYSRPCFSPDGGRILYMRARVRSDWVVETNSDTSAWSLWSARTDGADQALVYESPKIPATRPDWSFRNGRIAFTGIQHERAGLFVIDTLDTLPQEVPVDHPPRARVFYPSWYGHGLALTVTDWSTHELLRVEPESLQITRLTDSTQIRAGMSAACPDVSAEYPVAFAGQRPTDAYDPNQNGIWILDGRTPAFRIDHEEGRMPSWSPQNGQLCFQSLRSRAIPAWRIHPQQLSGGRAAIHVVKRPQQGTESRSTAVTPLDCAVSHAKWSPDGSMLVCTALSLRSGQRGIAIVEPMGGAHLKFRGGQG